MIKEEVAPIFIIGYMACGKTTFGKALAKAKGWEFIDLDFYIEQRFRMPITRIFAEKGEREFRRMESAMLREVGEFENVVVACGGGTPCFMGNMEYMNGRGLTVWLEATVERTVARLLVNNSRRPLMAARANRRCARRWKKDWRPANNIIRKPPYVSAERNLKIAVRFRPLWTVSWHQTCARR